MISRSPSLVVFRVEVRHQEGGLLLSGMASTQDEQAGIEAMLGFAAFFTSITKKKEAKMRMIRWKVDVRTRWCQGPPRLTCRTWCVDPNSDIVNILIACTPICACRQCPNRRRVDTTAALAC